ncbi:MAG: LysR family transcriptional regulator [Lysobacteraceae bacterium]|mgnify:CR=1 FL=1|nr:LysR family transcriptional regulator [Rhodanobacteraceae bacterium]HPF73984.1 LysR family transcriptional regulator [Xanthomonadaceae bacterium]HRY00360.1 LysR family transcriptional regulator [Xanthomonadaceae bacterium]
MDRLDAMRVFVKVVELGSFTRAAAALGLPKASVSTAVQQLEADLGTRLLHRTTRRVELSQDGQACLERCQQVLADIEELDGLFQQGQSLRGRLRVDMPYGVARNQVLPNIAQFLQRHPQLEIELSSTDRRVDPVGEGFDCVLRVGHLDDNSLVARPLGQFDMASCASPDYLARHGVPSTIADLAGHHLVHYVSRLGGRPDGFEYFDGERYREQPMGGRLTVNNSDAYRVACLNGMGIIQVPRIAVLELLADGELIEILPDFPAEPMPVTLLYPHRHGLPPRVRAFMAWLEELLAPRLSPLTVASSRNKAGSARRSG